MKRNTILAIFMVAIMAISAVGAFAGGVAASENVTFDGEDVSEHDQTNETVLPVDYSGENVTFRFTEPVEITQGESVEYSRMDGWVVDYNITEYSGAEPQGSSVSDGGFTINAPNGNVTVEEVEVTVAADSIPFAVGSEHQSPVDSTSSTMTWWYSQATDGERLALGAEHTEDFFLGVHETDENGTPITEDESGNFTSLGTSAEMEGGEYNTINVDLDEELENTTEVVTVLYNSENGTIGEPVTDDSGNMYTSNTWEPAIQDQLPSSDQLGNSWHLVSTPNGEEQAWNVYDPTEVVDIEYTVDNGEFNDGVYEPNETGEEAHFEVNITRNGTTYESLDLSNLEPTFSFDKNVFQNIEDVTELDSESLTLKEINEENSQKEYVFDVVQPNDDTATYTLELTATPTDASSTDAVSFGANIDPTGGPEVSDTEPFEIDEGADSALFTDSLGIDDTGMLAAAFLSVASIGLVAYVGYTKNVVGRIRNRDFSAEVFGIGTATVVVIVGAAEALSGTGIALTPAFDMVGYQAEQWVLGLIALAVAGLAAATTLDQDEIPGR